MIVSKEMLNDKSVPADLLIDIATKPEPKYTKEEILDWIEERLPDQMAEFLNAKEAKIGLKECWDKIPAHYIYNYAYLNQIVGTGQWYYKVFVKSKNTWKSTMGVY